MAEGLVRKLPPFSEFLNAAALGDTGQINYTNIARELGVARDSVRGYYQILSDTLLATLLPVYRKRPKRRLSIADKFYLVLIVPSYCLMQFCETPLASGRSAS
jgi:uncharacterized protein